MPLAQLIVQLAVINRWSTLFPVSILRSIARSYDFHVSRLSPCISFLISFFEFSFLIRFLFLGCISGGALMPAVLPAVQLV